MQPDAYPSVSLHNVAELRSAAWAADGHRLARVPSDVARGLNVAARERVRHPTGCELRFVPTDDGKIEVTLSAPEQTTVWPFWGAFQGSEPVEIGPTPRAITLDVPDRIQQLALADEQAGAFDPRVCRLRFDSGAAVNHEQYYSIR